MNQGGARQNKLRTEHSDTRDTQTPLAVQDAPRRGDYDCGECRTSCYEMPRILAGIRSDGP